MTRLVADKKEIYVSKGRCCVEFSMDWGKRIGGNKNNNLGFGRASHAL
jgi:hypothetical protein